MFNPRRNPSSGSTRLSSEVEEELNGLGGEAPARSVPVEVDFEPAPTTRQPDSTPPLRPAQPVQPQPKTQSRSKTSRERSTSQTSNSLESSIPVGGNDFLKGWFDSTMPWSFLGMFIASAIVQGKGTTQQIEAFELFVSIALPIGYGMAIWHKHRFAMKLTGWLMAAFLLQKVLFRLLF